ncbi:MAG: hypothetical protein Q8N23_07480 [Archangium sp.]|nr:hypothetical protein [Archangium sp.]MDP3152496.1 hypothetical protein [Archangium sp.]MDP3572334.1 hypothetical protein [Archangium sp.]
MNRELSRFLGFLAAAAALVLVLGVYGARLLGSAGGADGAIITHLKRLERSGAEHDLPWAKLLGPKLQFERISVVLDADGQGATVTSTLDFTGEVRRPGGGSTRVSSLGLERARYRLVDGEWAPEQTDFPRLLSILETLERRRLALDRGDTQPDGGVPFPGVTRRKYQGLAWYIRSEREDVTVSEDFRFEGLAPDRPIDEKATRRLSLLEDSTGLFSFPDGIL